MRRRVSPGAEHARIERLMKRLHAMRAKFRTVHVRGVAALKVRDYEALGDMIRRERDLIQEHRTIIERQQALIERRLPPTRPTPRSRNRAPHRR